MVDATTALIAFGANLGRPLEMLREVTERLSAVEGMVVVDVSQAYSTPAVTLQGDQPDYLNATIMVESHHSALESFQILEGLERELGRTRDGQWSPRSVDLDLLLFGNQVIDTEIVTIPHPRMSFRRFVLEPSCEIAAEMEHPTIGTTLAKLLAHINLVPLQLALVAPSSILQYVDSEIQSGGQSSQFPGVATITNEEPPNSFPVGEAEPAIPPFRLRRATSTIELESCFDEISLVVAVEHRSSDSDSTASRIQPVGGVPWLEIELVGPSPEKDREDLFAQANAAIAAMAPWGILPKRQPVGWRCP